MTTIYKLEELIKRLGPLCKFNKKKIDQIENLYYYDFDLEKWRLCKPIANLPCNLCVYKLLDCNNDNNVVITCTDSYRLYQLKHSSKFSSIDLNNLNNSSYFPSNEYMKIEQQCREEMVYCGQKLHFYDLKKELWVKTHVILIEHNIIQNVLKLDKYGYYYYESRGIVQFKNKSLEKIQYIQKMDEMDEFDIDNTGKIENIEDKTIKTQKFIKHNLYYKGLVNDNLDLYNNLNIIKLLTKKEIIGSNNFLVNIFASILTNNDIDGVFFNNGICGNDCQINECGDIEINLKNKNCFEYLYDIKITGINPNNCHRISLHEFKTEIVSATWNSEKKIYQFKDFTIDNPLFLDEMYLCFKIVIHKPKNVDLKKLKCLIKNIFLDNKPRNILSKMKWKIVKIPSRKMYFVMQHEAFSFIKEKSIDFVDG